MSQILQFSQTDYLTVKQIIKYFSTIFTDEKAQIIHSKISKYCLTNKGDLYRLQDNYTYEYCENADNALMGIISKLLCVSIQNLNNDDLDMYNTTFTKAVQKSNLANPNIKSYFPQLLELLKMDKIQFNNHPQEIHYNNGYMDIRTLQFKPRTAKHYITKYIQRDYIKSTIFQQDEVIKELTKIYPIEEVRETLLMVFGSSLSGCSSKDQTVMFLLGLGSSAKSFIMKAIKATFECYVKELQSNTFTQGNQKIDKIINSYLTDCQTLFTWINELKDLKMDGELFKEFVEGVMKTTQLFKDGQYEVVHLTKIFFTSNNMPNLNVDTGIIRRIRAYEHTSKFTENEAEVDESKHIYKVVKDLHIQMKKRGLLDAFADILYSRAKRYIDGEEIKYGQQFTNTSSMIVSANDTIQDFIDCKLIRTNEKSDFIGKDELLQIFLTEYPNKRLSSQQLTSLLKDKGIKYEYDKRYGEGKKGCFVGIALKYEKPNNDLDHGTDFGTLIIEEQETENDELRKKIEALNKQNEELKAELEKLKQQLITPKPVVEVVEVKEVVKPVKKNKSKKIEIQEEIKPVIQQNIPPEPKRAGEDEIKKLLDLNGLF
jgi:phage/plasmid-associated DNA primase